jgi:tape measure domain-containing protein
VANEFVYKVGSEADFSDLQRELGKLNAALASSRGSVIAFREELERDAKGQTDFKIVIRSEFSDSGTKVAKAELVEVSKQYGGLLNKIRQIEKEPQKNSITSLRQQFNEAKQARDAVSKYAVTFDQVGNKIEGLSGRWVGLNQKAQEFKRQLDIASSSNIWERLTAEYGLRGLSSAGRQITEFVNIFQSLSIVVGQVTASINAVVGALANLQSFSLAFESIGAGAAGGAQALAESSRIALNLGVDLNTVRTGFQQLSPVILNTGGTIKDVSSVVETLSSRFAAFGISGDRARRVTNGVIQAFAKGKLMAEELTQQISEADPAFKTDLAKALSVTTSKLEEMVKAGEVTGKVLLENLPKLSKSILLYGKLGSSASEAAIELRNGAVTIDQVKNKINAINQLSLEKLAKTIEPVLYVFIQIGASITDFISRVSELEVVKSIAAILGAVASQAGALVGGLLNVAEGFIVVIDAVNKFIGPLIQIPGVAQLIAVALASKIIGPLQVLKDNFLKGSEGATGFLGAIRSLTTFENFKTAIQNNLITPINKFGQAVQRSYSNNGLSITLRDLVTGSLSAKQEMERLGQQQLSLNADFAKSSQAFDLASKNLAKYQQRLESLNQIKATKTLSPSQDREVENLTQKIRASEDTIKLAERNMQNYTASLERVAARKKIVAANTTILQRSLKGVRSALGATVAGVRGLLSTLGPLGVAFIAIGAAVGAFQSANSESSAILQESKERIEVLKKAIEDLKGGAKESEKPVTGLALAWLTFGNVITDVVNSVSGLLDNLAKGLQSVTKGADGLASRLAIVLGAAVAGGFTGAAVGGPFAPLTAAIGAVTVGLAAYALTGNAAEQQARQTAKSAEALGKSFAEIVPLTAELGRELDRLGKTGKISEIGSSDREAFIQGLEQEKSAIQELQRIYATQKGLQNSALNDYRAAQKAVADYKNEIIRLTAERNKQAKIRDDALKARGTFDPTYQKAGKAVLQLDRSIRQNEISLQRAEAGVVTYRDKLLEAAAAAKLTEKEIRRLIEVNNERRLSIGFALGEEDGVNSIKEIQDEIKLLQNQVQNLNIFSPTGLDQLDEALTKIKAFEFIAAKLSRTKIEIEVELRNLQQEITESKLKIDLEAGPLRDAALQVSQITNDFKDAQTTFSQSTSYIQKAFEEGTINAQTQKRLLEEAGLALVNSSLKAKAAIIEAGREFKKQLDSAKSAYQDLLLGKPEFFTPGEIRKNAEQIEKDFTTALEKVRADTGDWSWGPKLTGKTYEEILKQKKEFVDTRKAADDLKNTIKNLSKVLDFLAKVLGRISGISLDELNKLKGDAYGNIDPKKLEQNAYSAQKAITGIGSAANQAAKAYGDVMGTAVMGGIEMIMTTEKATGAIVWLTKKEYDAAKAGRALGEAGSAGLGAMIDQADTAATALTGVASSSKEVIGTLSAAGEELFLVEDQFTGKVEQLTAAQLRQQGIVNNLSASYKALGISISTAKAATGEFQRKQREEIANAGPQAVQVGNKIGIDPTTTKSVIDAARRAGGDWLKTFSNTIAEGNLLPPRVLSSIQNASDRYRTSLDMLKLTTQEAKTAQDAYSNALAGAGGDLLTLAGAVENSNAALDAAKFEAEQAKQGYDLAAESARELGIDINSVVAAGTIIDIGGPKTLQEAYENARDSVLGVGTVIDRLDTSKGLEGLDDASSNAEDSFDNAATDLATGASAADGLGSSLQDGKTAAEGISNALDSIDGRTVNVNVNYVGQPGLWTGGPTVGGKTYRINELGQEGFLSSSGTLSPINKPRNALWKAPGKGMVIPAHIMSTLDIPTGRVSTGVRPSATGSGGNGLAKVARAIQAALSQTNKPDSGLQEMAAVQAHQAIQIGKLSRAVTKLADKDWNVNVGVRNTGGTAYLDALNRRM